MNGVIMEKKTKNRKEIKPSNPFFFYDYSVKTERAVSWNFFVILFLGHKRLPFTYKESANGVAG